MVNQTTVQNEGAIRFGSGKLEVGTSIATLVNIGAIDNAEFSEDYDMVEVKADNVGRIKVGVKDQTATIECDMLESDLSKLNTIRGGLDTYTPVAASPVAITNEEHVLTGTTAARLTYKEGDDTEVASIVVTDASDNAAVRNTDYVIAVDSAGYTTIARVSGSTVITDGDTAKVDYSYTPNTSVKLTSGGKYTISDRVVRITNTNDSSEDFRITLYKATIEKGLAFKYPADNSQEVMKVHLTMTGIPDTTRTAGDQLYEIIDEQGA